MRQEQQQQMLRGIARDGMMPVYQQQMMRMNQANGISLSQNELRQKAFQNTRNA